MGASIRKHIEIIEELGFILHVMPDDDPENAEICGVIFTK
jgi:hypothetical protein